MKNTLIHFKRRQRGEQRRGYLPLGTRMKMTSFMTRLRCTARPVRRMRMRGAMGETPRTKSLGPTPVIWLPYTGRTSLITQTRAHSVPWCLTQVPVTVPLWEYKQAVLLQDFIEISHWQDKKLYIITVSTLLEHDLCSVVWFVLYSREFGDFFVFLLIKYAHTFTGSVRGSESAEKESNAVTVQSTSTVTKKETKTEQTQTDKK